MWGGGCTSLESATKEEIAVCRDKCLSNWLPAASSSDWKDWQERPYLPRRSRTGKIKFYGPSLELHLLRSDVLHVVFSAVNDGRLNEVVRHAHSPSSLRAAQTTELSGQGTCHKDFRPSFLWQRMRKPAGSSTCAAVSHHPNLTSSATR